MATKSPLYFRMSNPSASALHGVLRLMTEGSVNDGNSSTYVWLNERRSDKSPSRSPRQFGARIIEASRKGRFVWQLTGHVTAETSSKYSWLSEYGCTPGSLTFTAIFDYHEDRGELRFD